MDERELQNEFSGRVPTGNWIVACQEFHAEVLDLRAGSVWQCVQPTTAEAYEALELPDGVRKLGGGVGVMDAHYFRRSPGGEFDGPVEEREFGDRRWIHCASPPAGGPQFPVGDDPALLRVDKHHSLVFEAGREVDVLRLPERRDYLQVIAASPRGGGLLQPRELAEADVALELPAELPAGWTLRTEKLSVRTVIHLPNPTEAWFFKSGASFQGPVDNFTA